MDSVFYASANIHYLNNKKVCQESDISVKIIKDRI